MIGFGLRWCCASPAAVPLGSGFIGEMSEEIKQRVCMTLIIRRVHFQ
jgi:hypothetical protein